VEENIFEIILKKQYYTQNGRIAYWVNEKNGHTCTLVFLHGLTADHAMFEKQISYFEKNYKILCWDAPAHGKSRPYINFSYENAANHLKSILDKERIDKAVLIGQSMGGYIAQAFLKRYPDSVKGFIGIDTTPFGLSYYSKMDRWWLRQVEWMSYLYPYKTLMKAIASSCTCTQYAYEQMLDSLKQYTKRELCHLMGIGYAGFLEENCDLDISCPTLILVGEHDKTGKVKQYCKAWHENTRCPLCIIKNAAHNSNVDNHAQVNEEIEKFVLVSGI
jgi:pimeloyl-ACP methyl ester carboxylesterase